MWSTYGKILKMFAAKSEGRECQCDMDSTCAKLQWFLGWASWRCGNPWRTKGAGKHMETNKIEAVCLGKVTGKDKVHQGSPISVLGDNVKQWRVQGTNNGWFLELFRSLQFQNHLKPTELGNWNTAAPGCIVLLEHFSFVQGCSKDEAPPKPANLPAMNDFFGACWGATKSKTVYSTNPFKTHSGHPSIWYLCDFSKSPIWSSCLEDGRTCLSRLSPNLRRNNFSNYWVYPVVYRMFSSYSCRFL